MKRIASIRNDIKRIDDLSEFNQNQVSVLTALYMVGEIFTGEFKRYKISDGKCKLLRSKSGQKESDIAKPKYNTEVFKFSKKKN